ncbi:unnamed protein product [Prunus armeniaca]|uniref:Uncharacterized protein n=1 Tax=Prunus armeniaca TaxID=36596 RepID=A0A6J5V928_PRUAR|nr:unnamed protein product [Prunus armeniaca]
MDEECDVIVLGTGLKECILSGLFTSQWMVSRSIEILSEQLLGKISRALKLLILPEGKGIRVAVGGAHKGIRTGAMGFCK